MQYKTPEFENKILDWDQLLGKLDKVRTKSQLVFTNGCFDILHRGHVTYLAQAKSLGNKLIVALNTDESVRRLGKSSDRPINKLDNRLAVIASLESVDYVTYFNEDTPLELIKLIQPNVLVKGGDWATDKIVGSQEVVALGGKVYSIPFLFDTSTTKLIDRIRHV